MDKNKQRQRLGKRKVHEIFPREGFQLVLSGGTWRKFGNTPPD